MVTRSSFTLLVTSLLVAACQPEFTDRSSAVTDIRILGVRAEPAEALPDFNNPSMMTYQALVADQTGTRPDISIDWAYCTLPTPVSELNDVSPACFAVDGPYIKPIGSGQSVMAPIPIANGENSCNQFGPDVPAAVDGGPPGRPADPDSTGGFYQPVRLLLVNRRGTYDFALAQTRIKCNLPGAPPEAVVDYQSRYRRNENPEIDTLSASVGGAPDIPLVTEDMGPSGLTVPAGTAVRLTATYASCPVQPACGNGFCEAKEDDMSCPADCTMPPKPGCHGAEPYAYYDLSTRTVVDRREAIRLSWFSNKGTFADDRTGRTEQEADATTTQNIWTAPHDAGPVTMWAVIRDNRGGLTWRAYLITVL